MDTRTEQAEGTWRQMAHNISGACMSTLHQTVSSSHGNPGPRLWEPGAWAPVLRETWVLGSGNPGPGLWEPGAWAPVLRGSRDLGFSHESRILLVKRNSNSTFKNDCPYALFLKDITFPNRLYRPFFTERRGYCHRLHSEERMRRRLSLPE